jgi:integrase
MRWKKLLQMVLTCWIYYQEIGFMLHLFIFFSTNKSYRHSVSIAYTGRILLLGKTSLTESDSQKRVEGATRQLVSPIEKKEPITPDMLLKLYNSVSKENNLMSQRIISSCLLPFAGSLRVSELLYIKRSDIIFETCYVSIFIPKSKTDIYRDGNTVVISRMDNNLFPAKKFRNIFCGRIFR